MSWRYKSYRRRKKSKFFFSERDIDFSTEYLDYNQFLLQEFFAADIETHKKIDDYYSLQYGEKSLAYLKSKYKAWANGKFHLTDMMKERILIMMPHCLCEEAEHKLGLYDFLTSIKKNVKKILSQQFHLSKLSINLKSPQQIIEIFESELLRIRNLPLGSFRFDILSDEEKRESLEISKYILETKLQISFNQIEKDFNTFLPQMFRFKRGFFSASYLINSFNILFDITNTGLNDITIPKFIINEIEVNSQFKTYADKYLAYELVNLHSDKNRSIVKAFLNTHDIKLFFDQYEELSFGENEVDMKSTFQGEGGTLSLQAHMKPFKHLRTAIIISTAKLLIYCIFAIGLISFTISSKLFGWLIIGVIFAGFLYVNTVSNEIKQLKILTTEIKQYGKQ